MKVKKGRDISKIARQFAEGNPLGYRKIHDMLKKVAPMSRQRWYQVKHKLMGLCAKCSELRAKDSADYCAYHQRRRKETVAKWYKRKKDIRAEIE